MKEDIISQKIRKELSIMPIDTEPRVMYLLVEIRKVLEHENNHGGLLRFYCDWVVHTKMDRNPAQDVYNKISAGNAESRQFISFEKLKCELREFLIEKNLPTELIDKHWKSFEDKLVDILVDTPLEGRDMVGLFVYRRTNGVSGIEFVFKNSDGSTRSLNRIIE